MIPYIIHISLLVALCYVFYSLLLEKETFYQLNRWVLAIGIMLAVAIPFYQVPQEYSLRLAEQWEVLTSPEKTAVTTPTPSRTPIPSLGLNPNCPPKPECLPQPKCPPNPKCKDNRQVGLVASSSISETPPTAPLSPTSTRLSLWDFLFYLYWVGVGIFALNFLIQLGLLLYKRYASATIQDGPFQIVEINEDKAPFSFWNYIYINPSKYDWDTFNQILQHEKIHVAQKHTLDILLAELLVIVQWFNPFAWLYRKAVENNLEYLTDEQMLAKGTDKESYQMNLLKVSVPHLPINLTTNYNQSILKKRIIMMNSKKSSVSSSWKYLFLLPILGLSIITFNSVKTTAQNTAFLDNDSETFGLIAEAEQPDNYTLTQTTETSDETDWGIGETDEASEEGTDFEENVDHDHSSHSTMIIGEFDISTTGSWTGEMEGNDFCVRLHQSKNRYNRWAFSRCFEASDFEGLSANAENFKLDREAGVINFQGKLVNGEGGGKFNFEPSTSFASYLQQEGFQKVDDELMFFLCMADINKEYFAYLKQEGYTDISDDELEALAHHGVSLDDLKETIPAYKAYGFNRMDIEDLMTLRIHDVSPAYLKEMQDLGFRDLDIDEVVGAKIHNVSPDFLQGLADAGYPNMDMDDVIAFAIHDVDADYVKTMKELGFRNLDKDEIVGAKIHGVSPEYLKELADMGYSDMDMDEVVGFAIHNVDAEYVKTMKELGFRDLDSDDIVSAKIHGVSPDYLRKLADMGYADMDLDEVTGFAIHNVDPEFVKEMKELGFRNLSPDEIVSARIHNVSPELLKEFANAGFGDMDIDQVTSFAIHNVDAEYIREMKSMGFRDFSADEIVSAKIHGVRPDFIRSFKEAGLENMSMDEVTSMSIHNVRPEFVKGLRDLGYKVSVDDATSARIHNLSLDYVKELHDLGFKNEDLDDVISARIHNLSPEFIKKAREDGHKDLDLEDYIDLKINKERGWRGNSRRNEH